MPTLWRNTRMSPTRRDVLKSYAVATIAVTLPKRALAAPDTLEPTRPLTAPPMTTCSASRPSPIASPPRIRRSRSDLSGTRI